MVPAIHNVGLRYWKLAPVVCTVALTLAWRTLTCGSQSPVTTLLGTFNIFVVFVMFVFICFLHKSFFVYFRITYLYQTQIIIFIIIRFVFFFNLLLNFTPAHYLPAVA